MAQPPLNVTTKPVDIEERLHSITDGQWLKKTTYIKFGEPCNRADITQR